jgi:hypothetical protein
MSRGTWKQTLLASPWLALPLFAVPTLCFTVNRVSFVWSVTILAWTGWKLRRAEKSAAKPDTIAKAALSPLGLTTFLLQMLVFAWIGAVWMLQGLGQVLTQSSTTSRIVGWIQAQWFADAVAWLILFAVVCALFRLARALRRFWWMALSGS